MVNNEKLFPLRVRSDHDILHHVITFHIVWKVGYQNELAA